MSILYSDIKFSLKNNSFLHNLKADYACFALWKSARPYAERIREYLNSNFEVLLETEIEWSDEHFHSNASRLYEIPIYNISDADKQLSTHAKKIGGNRFIFIVVKDSNPKYSYAMSVSKKIELSNLNIVKAKYTFRDWVLENSDSRYAVHSSNNIYEFLFQTPLVLGIELFNELLNGKKPNIPLLSKDLEGASGWSSWKHLFDILNVTNNYLILRNFEGLPNKNYDKDIDMLTDNYQRVASAIGLKQSTKKSYVGVTMIENTIVPFDIRFVGDSYYDCSWQKDMLETKINNDGAFIPRKDNYFFSLLYHCKVQKLEVKEKYFNELSQLAKELNFNWYSDAILKDDELSSEALNGFMRANNYYYQNPIDIQVIKNKKVIASLPSLDTIITKETTKVRLKKWIVSKFSIKTFLLLKKVKNVFFSPKKKKK